MSVTGPRLEAIATAATGARAVVGQEAVQQLWSGYGQIVRCRLDGGGPVSVIVKHVRWPQGTNHPRGWNTERSHQRKVRSYQVETVWYERYAGRCDARCRVPKCLAVEGGDEEVFVVLEDLDAAGFDQRHHELHDAEMSACLRWLAHFHATFMGVSPEGLWPVGTYWHLDTRPDELEALDDAALRAAASQIDRTLRDSPFLTLVHGDAKVANFCFTPDGRDVAAVDFQYVGGGCGMKDVAYFISSCLDEDECEARETALLDRYFGFLRDALAERRPGLDFAALERDWRALYPVAWTDFYRFLKGWSPGHWKIHRYSERLAREVLASL